MHTIARDDDIGSGTDSESWYWQPGIWMQVVYLDLLGQWLNGLNFLGLHITVWKISRSNFYFRVPFAK